ncbi:uncharacterized protein KIAA2012 homolog [Eublepharis macularius]|uniref:Uncharacterized protein KIAA2012 homolog n=1 Tax=Eublepharis macularius TaxID=481883 RepID=A0AA97IY60_EUBMA|nr:uncharacterized protein KIAA2012 homolog [Eublepharis macularius]
MPNLSLLSRGAGQVVKTTQEKLEVHVQPEDYFNWMSPEYHCDVSSPLDSSEVMERPWRLYLPKTYSTKTGGLVLYSEGLAKSSRKLKGCKKSQRRLGGKSRTRQIEPHTLQDLVRAILAYGSKEAWEDQEETAGQPNLHFLSDPAIQSDRRMRPGYSAKRYLLKLTQILDPSVLQKLQHAGHIRDPFVLEEYLPYHRKKEQDLSAIPPKYNLLPIFCSPCSYLWAELEKANPGLGLSSYKKSENEAWLVEGYKGEEHVRGKARIPLRISIRKLSFRPSRQSTKGSTWNLKASYRSRAEDPNVGIHQNRELTKEDEGQSEMVNLSSDCAALEKICADTSELWCEKSHVTFYGGFFPGRKISDSVNQRDPKCPEGREGGASSFLPLIQPGRGSEQAEVRKPQRKQMPEIFRLPVISEDPLRARRQKLKSRELPKELLVLPLLVRLERDPQAKRKKPRVAGCPTSSSGADACNKLLAPLPNYHFSDAEGRNEQQQVISGDETPETLPSSSHLPPISSGEIALSRAKTRKRERDKQHPKAFLERDLGIQGGIPTLNQLPAVTRKKDPGGQADRANSETSTSTSAGINGVCKDPFVKIANSVLQEELGECDHGTSLSRLPMSPGGEIVCVSPLGPIQTTVDDAESLETKIGAAGNQPETSFSAPEFDEKVIPQAQEVGKVPEHGNSLPNEQGIMGNGSTCAEFRREVQPSLGGFCGNSLPLQRTQRGRLSGVPRMQGPKQREVQVPGEASQGRRSRGKPQMNSMPQASSSRATGKQMENSPRPERFSLLEPGLSQWAAPESEVIPHAAVLEFPGLSKELRQSPGMCIRSPEEQVEAGKDDDTTLPENPSLRRRSVDRSSAGDGLENKLMTRQKKPELRKTGPESKAQKKSLKKDKRQNRAEFVVGKPKQKKAFGKTASFSKEEPDVRRSETPDKTEEEEERKEADAEGEQIITGTEEDTLGGALDKSPPPSSRCLMEESPLPPGSGQAFPADVDCPSGSPALETPVAAHPIVSPAIGSQASIMPSSELPEVLPETRGEERLSRERIIAERAEKRRLAVERRRREQEELKQKQWEEEERMESMKEEMEEERRRRIEEIRLRKRQLEEECRRQEEEAARKLQAEKAAQERLRQQQEELRRKLLEAQKKKEEEEQGRAEAEKRRQKDREMWLEEERRHLAEMAEEQRVEYEKRKREEEERARREAEQRRRKAEEATRLALEEARKQALLLARQEAELEEKLQFHHKLFVEASGLEQRQDISRPWVYSYFQHPFLKVGKED